MAETLGQMVEELGEHKLIIYNWISEKMTDDCHYVLILDSEQFDRVIPKISNRVF